MKPIIKWQTHTTEATAKVLGVELSVKSNGKGKFESTVYCSGMRPEKDHTFDTLDDGKAWCEQTLQRWINASFDSVITQPVDATEPLTLIEKLEKEKNNWHDDGENNVHRVIDDCIDIVKHHQAESDWISVDERLPEHGGTYPALADGRFGIAKFDPEYNAWLFKNFEVYELMANVTHWMPLPKPPSEVQDD